MNINRMANRMSDVLEDIPDAKVFQTWECPFCGTWNANIEPNKIVTEKDCANCGRPFDLNDCRGELMFTNIPIEYRPRWIGKKESKD